MKSKMRLFAMILACLMILSMVACDKEDPKETDPTGTSDTTATTEPTVENTSDTSESTTDTSATEPTGTTSDTSESEVTSDTEPVEPGVEPPAEGLMVFYEDFNAYANDSDTANVMKTIGWTKLLVEGNGVYSESDAEFAIVDGRLYYDNYDVDALPEGDTRVRGKDSYYAIDVLNEEYMKPVVFGKYTLQYDLEYIDAGNNQRYAVIITECSPDGQCYNSFHFRIRGKADHQCHFYGSWKTYSAYDPATDLHPAADAVDGSKGTPILTTSRMCL